MRLMDLQKSIRNGKLGGSVSKADLAGANEEETEDGGKSGGGGGGMGTPNSKLNFSFERTPSFKGPTSAAPSAAPSAVDLRKLFR